MGEYETLTAALVALLEAALPSTTPVLNGLSTEDIKAERLASFVGVIRERITFSPHVEMNPNPAAKTQVEKWSWLLLVKGGGGRARSAGKGTEVDKTLETIRTALNAQKLDSTCGPLSVESEDYAGTHGTGVIYEQRWTHER